MQGLSEPEHSDNNSNSYPHGRYWELLELEAHHSYQRVPVQPTEFETRIAQLARIADDETVFAGQNDLEAFVHRNGHGLAYTLFYIPIDLYEEHAKLLEGIHETVLSKAEHKTIFNQAARAIFIQVGKYIRPNVRGRVFPGLTMENLADYDFESNGRISLVVLPFEDYQALHVGEGKEPSNIIHNHAVQSGQLNVWDEPKESTDGPYKPLNLSARSLLVLAETLPTTDFEQITESEFTTQEQRKEFIERVLRATLIHEIFHTLELLEGNDSQIFRESVVEFYSTLVHSAYYSGIGIPVGYSSGVLAVRELFNLSQKAGISGDMMNKAVISNDPMARKEIYTKLSTKYGEVNARRMLDFKFPDGGAAYNYFKGLTQKRGRKKKSL